MAQSLTGPVSNEKVRSFFSKWSRAVLLDYFYVLQAFIAFRVIASLLLLVRPLCGGKCVGFSWPSVRPVVCCTGVSRSTHLRAICCPTRCVTFARFSFFFVGVFCACVHRPCAGGSAWGSRGHRCVLWCIALVSVAQHICERFAAQRGA